MLKGKQNARKRQYHTCTLGECGIHSQRRHQEVVLAVTLIGYFMV